MLTLVERFAKWSKKYHGRSVYYNLFTNGNQKDLWRWLHATILKLISYRKEFNVTCSQEEFFDI
jgi:hypothetical protein